MYRAWPFGSAAVLGVLLGVVGSGVLGLVLGIVGAVGLIGVVGLHNNFLRFSLRHCRMGSLPDHLGFILRFEHKAGDQSADDSDSDTAGSGFQTTGNDTQKALFIHSLPDAL